MLYVASKHQENLACQISNFIDANDKVSWEQISAHVTGELGWKIRKHGWLGVRAALQVVINAGEAARTKNIRVEEYVSVF